MANVSQKTLSELTLDSTNIVVTAVILSKTDPNVFQLKESNEYRSVTLLTIRDSKRCVINCKCWGSKEKIEDYHRKFNIYDVVDIICPKVVRIRDNQQEHFQPIVTLPFQLVVNEGTGFIEKHLCDIKEHKMLCKLSIRTLSSVLNLADIYSTNINFRSHYVDLLVAVALMKPVKDVRTKSGYPLKCLELAVIDKTLPSGMILTIWNSAWIERSQKYWKQYKTVLHLIDVKVGYSEFNKSTTLGLCARSLIFENPIGKEVEIVAQYAGNAPPVDIFVTNNRNSLPDPNMITTLMTVKQIYDHSNGIVKINSDEFTAVLLGVITKFEIDGHFSIIAKKCKSCGHRMLREEQICANEQCQMGFSFNYSGDKFDNFIDINIHLSDHTGTLVESRLSGSAAEQVLKLTVEQFIRSSEKEREDLKWQFLLERFEVKILAKKATATRQGSIIQVVDMNKIEANDLSEKIVIY